MFTSPDSLPRPEQQPAGAPRYRWAVLAGGTAAQASFAAFGIGLPVLAPALREEYGLGIGQIGVVLASEWVGTLATLVLWGLAADRAGERLVLGAALGGCGLFLGAAAYAPGFASLVVLVALAGAAGVGVTSASGRAVMHWFGPSERGLALGLRQSAIPLGGLVGAVVLPHLTVEAAFLFLSAVCLAGAAVGSLVIRERSHEPVERTPPDWTLRDRRLWRVCLGSGLYLVAQVAVIGFVVLFLHDERGFSAGAAGGVLAAAQVGAVVLRIAVGRWSDALRARVVPLRHVGLAIFATVALAAALVDAPTLLLVPALVVAGALSMAWNGLSFAAAAELAGPARSGAAIGFQQSVLSAIGAGAPLAFAATVATAGWRAAFALAALFPLAGWLALRPLVEPHSDTHAPLHPAQ